MLLHKNQTRMYYCVENKSVINHSINHSINQFISIYLSIIPSFPMELFIIRDSLIFISYILTSVYVYGFDDIKPKKFIHTFNTHLFNSYLSLLHFIHTYTYSYSALFGASFPQETKVTT